MTSFWLKFTLTSDATFGRGDGVAGLVDAEVQHDEYGLVYLGGRALRGMLAEACADILFALQEQGKDTLWHEAAQRLFGNPGSGTSDQAILYVGDARLPQDLRRAVIAQIGAEELDRERVLNSLTAIRRQTKIDPLTGAPQDETLRAMRVVLRGTSFEAELAFVRESPTSEARAHDLALLSACVKAWRHAGTGRNRGRGELVACLCDVEGQDVTDVPHLAQFKKEVLPQ